MSVARAIVLFPEGDLTAVESVRHELDPLAHIIAAHIALVFPFASDVSSDVLEAHMACVASQYTAFRVKLDDFEAIDDGYICYRVMDGADIITRMHDELYTGPLAEFLSATHIFRPHMTVAHLPAASAQAEALSRASEALSVTSARITCMSVFRMREDGSGFREVDVPFGR